MTNHYSTIQLSRRKAFDYIHPIIYKQASTLLYKEYFGVNQNCKYNHLIDYYYLIELLTSIKKRINCIIENECLTYDKLKAIYDSYGLDCVLKCFACHNLPTKEIVKAFDINLDYVNSLEDKYLLQYEIQLFDENKIISSTTQQLLLSGSTFTLPITNPNLELYDYISLIVDNKTILPPTTTVVFENVECIHNVIAKFRLKGCLDAAPTVPVLVLSNVLQTAFTVTWNSVGTNVNYLVELLESNVVTQSFTQTSLTRTFSGLLPSSDYKVRVTATNCAGTTNAEVTLQTAPFLVIVSVINGTSPDSGTNTVAYNSNFTVDFTSTGAFSIQSFKVNNVTIPTNTLNITGYVTGIFPQTGTYQLTSIQEDKYVEIIYATANVCNTVDMTYNSTTNTITIA